MIVRSEKDLLGLFKIGKIVALARDQMIKALKPGITTKELDNIAKYVLEYFNAHSAPMKDYGFPAYSCISVNEEAAHGIPGSRIIKPGDLVNIDVSGELEGYYADTGASVVVARDKLKERLCSTADRALSKALEEVQAGRRLNNIGKRIYEEARQEHFSVIRNLSGHGTGRKLHEYPENILTYPDKENRAVMEKGMVLAVETFISSGARNVVKGSNGWTYYTPDKSFVAQYEHTVIVTEGRPFILTDMKMPPINKNIEKSKESPKEDVEILEDVEIVQPEELEEH